MHGRASRECGEEAALPDDLSPDRVSLEEHRREFVHGYHLLRLLHGSSRLSERGAELLAKESGTRAERPQLAAGDVTRQRRQPAVRARYELVRVDEAEGVLQGI